MNKYKKLASYTVTVAIVGMSSAAFADSQPKAPERSISLYTYLSGDARINQDGSNAAEGLWGLELQMTKKFKANLAAQLKSLADEAEAGDLSDADWEKIISEANITFDLSLGTAVAEIQFGKRDRSPRLQQTLTKLDRTVDSPLAPQDDRGIIGLWVTVPTELLGELNLSISETEGDDFKFNDDQIRMTASFKKALSQKLTAVGAVGFESNSNDPTSESGSDDGYAVTVGVMYDVTESLTLYGDVTHFEDYSGVIGSELGYNLGFDYDVSNKTVAGVAYESFNDEDKLYAGLSHTLPNGIVATGGVFVKNISKSNQDEGIEAMLRIPVTKIKIK